MFATMRSRNLLFGKSGVGLLHVLVAGAMQQQRLLSVAPVEVTEEVLAGILHGSIESW
jgi:hypothetical protein